MAQGGQLLNGNDFGSVLFPKAAGALSEIRKNNSDLAVKQGAQSAASEAFGGFDPRTGITWNSGRPDSPVADYANNPIIGLAGRIDPGGTLSAIASQVMAPPKPYAVTDPNGGTKTQLLTWQQAVKLQGQGYQINDTDKTKPIDPNTPPTMLTAPGPANKEQSYLWRPGMSQPQAFGQPGKFVNTPQSDLGKMGFDLSNFSFGGGSSLGTGSGSPQSGSPANAGFAGGTGAGSTIAPLAAHPATAQSAMPSLADAFTAKITAASRLPEQQAALNKTAEIEASNTAAKPQEAAKAEGAFNNHLIELGMLRKSATDALNDPKLGANFGIRSYFPNVRGFGAANAEAKLDTVRNQSIMNVMQSARDMSQTGASGIRLMQSELPIFQNALGNLSNVQDVGQAKKHLQDIIDFTNQAEGNVKQEFQKEYGRPLNLPQSGASAGWSIKEVK